MEPVSMDAVTTRIHRRTPAINLLTAIFLKSVYFLDQSLSKSAFVGIFKDREDSMGMLFKGKEVMCTGPLILLSDCCTL